MSERTTPLHQDHVELGARMVPFAGWSMPIRYTSQIDEHHAVRRSAGMFDVSHMVIVDLRGENCREFLRHLLANDVARLSQRGQALYTCMLNPDGGIRDDLIVYHFNERHYRVVLNAAVAASDLAHIHAQLRSDPAWARIELVVNGEVIGHLGGSLQAACSERPRPLAMIAVQGPEAPARLQACVDAEVADAALALKPFRAHEAGEALYARTGYTGEDGFEIMLPEDAARRLWRALLDAGVTPCGLGARDTLRLEAGLHLYGQDMDDNTTPLVCGLGWTVAWEPAERDFVGRAALEKQQRDGVPQRLVGLVLDDRAVLRTGCEVHADGGIAGQVTSGTFSPSAQKPLGLARVQREASGPFTVRIRNKDYPAREIRPPFVRKGKVKPEVLDSTA